MRPRRYSLIFLALVLALVLLPTVVLWPRGGTVEAGGVLGSGWTWGDDSSRQLGNGAPNDGNFANAPVQAGPVGSQLTNIIAVAGGTSHSLALRTNGIVLAWGSDSQGQLGDGAPNDGSFSNVPVSVSGLSNVVAIAAGGQHSLALRRDGTVWAWGNDGSRQLGNGTANDGASSNVPVQVVGVGGSGFLTNVIAIAAGGSHSLALRSNGTVVSWGDDFQGQLGNGPANDLPLGSGHSNVPVDVSGLSNVTAIAAGGFHSVALRRDSTVVSWGNDNFGQLGNSAPFNGSFSNIPVQVSGLTNAIALAAGRDHSLALKSDGTVVAWGYDQFGQLGNGVTTDGNFSDVPVAVTGLSNVSEVAGGTSHSLARRGDGSVVSWGRDNAGQLGNGSANDGTISNTFVSVSTLANTVAIAGGGTHGLAIRSATNLRGWGSTNYGQFGNNNVAPDDCDPGPDVVLCANIPIPITALANLHAVAAGERHTVGLTSDGAVWAWGDDSAGQLGNGLGAPNSCSVPATPCALSPVPVSGLSNIVAVAAGDRHSLALRRDGTVWSWGSHVFFQLGNGGTAPNTCDSGPCAISPVQVSGLTGIVAIAANGSHSLALRDNGTVFSWGNGTSGQLGNGASSSSNTPVAVSTLTNAVAIAAGGNHSLALRDDGTVVSWGSDSNFQLGNGAPNNGASSNVPVIVTGLSGAIAVAGGGNHSLALKDDGTVAAWGDDNSGQLGNNFPATDSDVFVTVSGLSTVVALAAGANHSLALKSDGTVSAWGLATPALLGNGGTAPHDCDAGAPNLPCAVTPVNVSSLTNIVAITAGAAHNLAISHPADTTSVNAQSATSNYGLASVNLTATVSNTGGATPVGEGTVTFTVRDGANAVVGSPITSATVVNGVVGVTFPLVGVPAASYTIHVTYSGSTNFLASIDLTPASLVVNKATTSVTVSAAAVNYGVASVQLSATVANTASPPAALTGGTVTFSVSGGVCSSAAIPVSTSSSSAVVNFTCTLGSTGVGTYVITATYSGDANFNGSADTDNLVINRTDTTTTIGASGVTPASVSFCGNSVTITANVTSATGVTVNEGTVNFVITGPGSLGPVNGIAVVNGVASTNLTLGTATSGSYAVTATYVPLATTPNFNGSTTGGSGNGAFGITARNTTTTVSAVTRTYGQSIPLQAQVVTNPTSGCNVNTGNVTFVIKQGATTVATVPPVAVNGGGTASATYTTPVLPAGSYTIEASYGATTNFNASLGSSALTVQKANTSTTAANLAGVYGGSVQLTATVTNTSNGVNLTGGTVTFVVAQTPTTVCTPAAVAIPTDDDSVIVNATCNFGTVAPGTYAITATYSGDANFNGSDNTLALGTLTISKADTSTGVSVASATYGTNSVTLNATVGNTPNNAALTGGTVQFIVSQGATTVCTVTSGAVVGADPRAVSASCPLNTPPRAGAGTYTIDATYSGDANFNGSVGSNTLTINKASTTTAAINATATYGDNSVTLSATVGNSSNNVDLTGGTVTFTIADVCTVVSGPVVGTDPTTVTASCPIDGPPREGGGTYNIGAAYSGDANFNSSIDASPGTLTINAAMSSTTVSNVSGPYGGSVQLSATVQSGNGVALTGGSVTLVATGVCSATVPITAGSASANVQATCSFGTVAPGVYALTATYSGNADVTGSGATPGTATITQANTAISVTDVSVAFGAGTAQLSATVQNNSGTASITGGTVDFNIPGVCNPGPVAVPATGNSVTVSTTACNPSAAALGTYAIEAVYSGDTNFAGSTATPGTLTVGTANSTTAAADVAVTYGSAEVQLSATVQSNTTAALTGGSVTFAVAGGCTSGALPIPTGSVTAVVTFDCPLGSLAAGAHTITATYSGDGNFVGGNDTATLTVNKANTTTATLGVSATYGGGSVQLSATVSNASNGANLTGGTVNFVVGPIGSPVCTPSVAVPAGGNPRTVTATCAPGIAAPGTYAIVANYVGDANFSNSTSSPAVANLTIAKANTSLQVSNASITYAGGNVQLTATVTNTSNGANLSGGTVDFNVAGVCDPGPVAVPTAGSSGQVSVSCAVGTVAPNPAYAISANYSGDTNFNSSVGSGTLTINKRTPIVSVNDVTVGVEATEVILTATLSSGDASINLSGGTFTLSVAGICDSGALAVPTDDDTASYQFTCVLNGAAPGVYTINGSFSGDANFNAASDTATLDIDQPTIPLTVSVNNSSVHVVATGIDEMVNTVTVIQIMPGEPVTATAQAQGGFTFVGWTFDGAEVGWANPVTLTVDGPHTLEANFVQTPVFPDVQPDQLFTNAVNQLAARGLIRGYQNGNFGPNDRVQRSQMAALIARAMPAGPGTPTNGTLTPPACLVAGSWDCEDWGNDFFNPGGVDPNLWRNVGALASHNVAFGYGDGTFGPFDDVTYAQTISFITRAMIEKGYWQSLPGTPHPYLNVPGAHAADVATFYFYTQAAQFGGVPDGPVAGNGGFGDWNSPSTRGWFARALWAAVNSYFGQDVAGMGGFIP